MRIHFLLFALLVQYAVSDFQSPISISDVQCASYNVFNIQMSDLTTTAAAVGAIDTNINGYKIPYTGASVTYNTTEFTSQYLTFRTPSEHILPQVGTNSAAELQIVMTSGDQTAVLSFLVRNLNATSATSTNNLAAYFNSPYANVLSGFTSTDWQFNLNNLGQLINNKSASSQFLNIYTYDGTLGLSEATWFVYGTEILATSDVITTLKTLNGGNNNKATTGSHVVGRMCFTGFFNVDMGDNFGLWFGVVSILLFFIFTLTTGDKPITDPDYEEDVWTHHPLVSVYKYGDELHTRKTRCALILVMVTTNALFCSVFYRTASDPTLATNIIVFAVYSMLIDSVVTFLVGNLLRRYYLAKHQFAKTHEEAWEQKSQNRLFAYYIAVFIVVVVGWSFTVWNMGELHPEVDAKPSKLWVASFFVALGLEFAFMYPIGVALAKSSSGMRKLLKRVGFMHDHICHETYMDYIKQE